MNLTIFASGSGSNAENIARYFKNHPRLQVKEILSNNSEAFVHERAKSLGIPSFVFSKEEFNSQSFIHRLKGTDVIVLAGFLWLIPEYLVSAFPNRIINIHPALLPKFGGKGMYGSNVHKAVVESGEKESGITIHLVNEEYDKGEILHQSKCEVDANDSPEDLAKKIHELEYEHFPRVIAEYIQSLN